MIKKGKASRADFGLGTGEIDKMELPKGGLTILAETDSLMLEKGNGGGNVFLDIYDKDGEYIGAVDIRWFLYDEQGGPSVDIIVHDVEPKEVGDILNWKDENYYRILIRKDSAPHID